MATTSLLTSLLRKSLATILLGLCATAMAQQSPPAQKPSEAPPKLDVIEEGADAPITVTPPKTGGAKITEKKDGGRVTEATVKSGKSQYTMRAKNPASTAAPGVGATTDNRSAQWTVLEFDIGGKKKNTDKEAVPDAPTPAKAPPPPPMPAAGK